MKKLFILGFTVFLMACGGQETKTSESTNKSVPQSQISSSTPLVEVVHPEKRTFESDLVITGNLEANQQVTLHAMESGYLRSINKDIGDRVGAGQLIASLFQPELNQNLIIAEAELSAKKSIYDRLNGIFTKTPDLTTASEVEMAKAKYESALAIVNASKTRIGFLQVKAPFSGTITKRYVDQGALIQSGLKGGNGSPIVDIMDIDPLRLVVEFPESDLTLINKGTKVSVNFPEIPGMGMDASITRLSNALNPQTKTMRAEIDLPNKNGKLKPGMFAVVKTELKSSRNAFSVPILALSGVKGKNYIYLVRNKLVEKMEVKLGQEDKFNIEILTPGLKADDQVVVKGKQLISEGIEVEPIMKESGDE